MSDPASRLSKLSLGSMAPTTRLQSRTVSRSGDDGQHLEDASSDPETDSDSSLIDDDTPTIVRAPSRLLYNLGQVGSEIQAKAREAFKDPPRLSLQYCRLRDGVYAFQMTELVHRSIRIGSPDSNFPTPRCSCGHQRQAGGPCKHVLWFLDQVVKNTMYDHESSSPLTMTPDGYPREVGDPYTLISAFHLGVLADALHCEVVNPDSLGDEEAADDEEPNPQRVLEAREILSSVVGTYPPEEYRPDIFANPTLGTKVVKRRDLESTVFRMLLSNNEFFHYCLSLARSSDPVRDPFRKLQQRLDRVLHDLDTYSSSSFSSSASSSHRAPAPTSTSSSTSPHSPFSPTPTPEGPHNVPWAATHITGIVKQVKTYIFNRDVPLSKPERTSAAKTLLHVLASVVSRNRDTHAAPRLADRNLYSRLIGDATGDDFVVGLLLLLPDAAAPFLQDLEAIADDIGRFGAPTAYVAKLGKLMASLKKPATGAGGSVGSGNASGSGSGKRPGGAQERGSKRVK